ncbi:MAG: glycerophosphodiester phosphodiesterase [Ilumatobacter sp.]
MNVIGHRGASVAEPENTPNAFATADAMGADGVELDVRITTDGEGAQRLVVFHDPLPAAQAEVDALPDLSDVLESCGQRMLVNVELKNSADDGGHDPTMAVVAPTVELLRSQPSGSSDRWLFSSFDLATIETCRLVAPEIPTGYLVLAADDDAIAAARAGGHAAIHPWAEGLTEDRVRACHEAGLVVNTWTCNDVDRLVELERIGVDGVCTDVPDRALEALGRGSAVRPAWGTRA